ncbi:cyclin-D-binding Myb-like transcription factor 1 [Pecten maximus]|uniref:cyclin-D-binding Myb-like transcription factor 1 n=1 Tax=Pecten maximus TaxID=6579 RepID=UPI001458B5F2|nr:cyclin-D-binding Myb-like transcription factor 1 [Pecten maximus]
MRKQLLYTMEKFQVCKVNLNLTKKMGINIRVGKWTQQEDSILVKNYEAFKSEHAMEMDNDFLLQLLFEQFVSSTKADRAKARKFRKHSNFCVELAGNLRRLPESVLDRARKILPAWNTGPFTPEEEETLLSLHKKFGNQWTIIGYHMNRSRNSVLDHYQVIKDGKRRKGTWTKEESDDLIAAMSEVMETDDLFSLPHYNIPWTKICKKIKHRSGKQCRTHWLYNLRPKLVQGGEHVKQVDATKLITEVYNLEVETECEIDWEDMLEKMPEAGTPQNLIHQWQRLKAICGVDSMNFDQIREKLAEFYKTHV